MIAKTPIALCAALICASCADTKPRDPDSSENARHKSEFVTFPLGNEAHILKYFELEIGSSADIESVFTKLRGDNSYIYPDDQTPKYILCSKYFPAGKIKRILSASIPIDNNSSHQKVSFGFDSQGHLVCADVLKPK